MKSSTPIWLVILAIAGLLLPACSSGRAEPTATPQPTAATPAETRSIGVGGVSSEVIVMPAQHANLAFESGGRVVAVNVSVGDWVKQGDILAQVDDTAQQAALAKAQAGVTQAKAGIAQAEADVASAQAGVAQAEANLTKVLAGPTAAEIAQLEANLAAAQARLNEMINSPTDEDVQQAQAAVDIAQAQLDELLAGPRAEDIAAASARALQAQAAVKAAQSAYDRVRYGDPKDAQFAGLELEKATLAYQIAQAEFDKLNNGATPQQITVAKARLSQAKAALATVLAGASPEQIAQAQAGVTQAEEALKQAKAGATDEDIAIAKAAVEQAQSLLKSAQANLTVRQAAVAQADAALSAAQSQLNATRLIAPFDGQVGTIDINVGDTVAPVQPVLSLGDTTRWQVQTNDLNELDIVAVKIGAKATVQADALPGETFTGKVRAISPAAKTVAGDKIFTVWIDIVDGDTSQLRWGMTALADIETE